MSSRIVVAATLSSTLNPTRDLIRAAGREVGKEIQVEDLLCTAAWHRLEVGDREGYYNSIVEELVSVPGPDKPSIGFRRSNRSIPNGVLNGGWR